MIDRLGYNVDEARRKLAHGANIADRERARVLRDMRMGWRYDTTPDVETETVAETVATAVAAVGAVVAIATLLYIV